MVLWSNTADGWGSDAGKSGNGQLGSYLQSSLASAPTSPSEKQAADPNNSMPTASVARMMQPAVSRGALADTSQVSQATPAILGGVISLGGSHGRSDYGSTDYKMDPGATSSWAPGVTYERPTPVAALPTYAGQTLFSRKSDLGVAGIATDYYRLNPITRQVEFVGSEHQGQYSKAVAGANYARKDDGTVAALVRNNQFQNFDSNESNFGNGVGNAILASQKSTLDDYTNKLNTASDANNAQVADSLKTYWTQFYTDYLKQNGKLPDQIPTINRSAHDAEIRAAVMAQYNQTKALDGPAFMSNVPTVDTSQQDAINQSSIAALASRYSTNVGKGDLGSVGRLYSSAVGAQTGVNKQLSDEAYATGFNRNLAYFNQAVQNQATIDTNATGTKLQGDITAMGDSISKLQQQVKQLGTASGLKINDQLNQLQQAINNYKAQADKYGADRAETVSYGKAIIGAVVGITAIALAPVTGGVSLAAGAVAGSVLAQ